ncbi:MAG: OmpA family protein [Gammaproteobacteria bacterium]|nr:OmpA family protein [Gammaproteobacteria bacterium]
MSDEAIPKKEADAGAPAWVMTFADLMSLLMCFFVLLLSFSEMDLNKYKQVAGSMKNAFGVQRQIKTMAMPKGTSVIAREFSPGRPSPTPLNVIRQNSIDDTKQTLEFTDVTTKLEDGDDDTSGLDGDGSLEAPIQRPTEAEQVSQLKEMGIDEELLENYSQALDTDPQTAEDAQKLLKALEDEVRKGLIEIVSEGKKILVRIREKGSFPSGSASFRVDFLPVIVKLRTELKSIEGQLRIAGHTDNVPINTVRFRSNWELSASRSVTVAHELLKSTDIDQKRFVVEGHGDAHPIAPNDTAGNRALNRRVELTIVQGEDEEKSRVLIENPQAKSNVDDNYSETKISDTNETQMIDSVLADDSNDPFVEIAAHARGEKRVLESSASQQKALEERIKKFSDKSKKTEREDKL